MDKKSWQIKDILDLEYLLQVDKKTVEDPASRDREIYLKHIQPKEQADLSSTPGKTIRGWLEQRRKGLKQDASNPGILPGETFDEIYALLKYGLLIIGFMIGAGLAFSFLNYRGTEPVNVAAYLGGFILTQFCLLLLLFFLSLFRMLKKSPLRSSVIYTIVTGLIAKLIYKYKSRAAKTYSGSQRDALEATLGHIQGKRQIYGFLFYWPVFILSQFFMVALNIGIISATLLKVLGADIAFGWQSTIQFSPEFILEIVQTLSLPWSWFISSGMAYPSLAQIEGSHMILKDGIYHLATNDLISWWPFLCFSVLFYGLLPRLILIIIGFGLEKRGLMGLEFRHNDCEKLYSRMITQVITSAGEIQDSGHSPFPSPSDESIMVHNDNPAHDRNIIALIPSEIEGLCPEDHLKDIVLNKTGYNIVDIVKLDQGNKNVQEIKKAFSQSNNRDDHLAVLIVYEAWQPPIRETLSFIREIRNAIGDTTIIKIGLIGRPGGNTFFNAIKDEDWYSWDKKLKTVGDPYLNISRLEISKPDRERLESDD